MIPFQGTAALCAHVQRHIPPGEGGVHSVQVVLGDHALPSDGKRKGPSRQLDRPAHKLVLLVLNDMVVEVQ